MITITAGQLLGEVCIMAMLLFFGGMFLVMDTKKKRTGKLMIGLAAVLAFVFLHIILYMSPGTVLRLSF